MTPYVCVASPEGEVISSFGETVQLREGETALRWKVPQIGGQPIVRVGFAIVGGLGQPCRAVLRSLDWQGSPEQYGLCGAHQKNITDPAPFLARMFVSSAKNFGLSLTHTLSVSHPEENGVVTFGTRDFDDYSIRAKLLPHLQDRCGLVLRARGHRQYYAALLSGGDTLSLVLRDAAGDTILAQTAFSYAQYEQLEMTFSVRGNRLTAAIGNTTLRAEDSSNRYPSGGVGFRVDCGTMAVDDIVIRSSCEP